MQLIKNATKQKLRGGFYSPKTISDFILRWAFNGNKHCDILEPSAGDGVFVESLVDGKYQYNSVTAIEIETEEAIKIRKIPAKNLSVFEQDFHKYCNNTNDSYDIIVGNPPYIRYQYFDKVQQQEAEKIFNRNNIKYSKLMNSWCAFVVGCTNLLKENGKLGFVLPAELLQVSHAKLIRDFLIKNYEKISIVSFKKLVFDAIQQDVVLLLCQKGKGISHIEYIEVEDDKCLKNMDLYKLKNPVKNIHNSSKWTNYFLEQKELDFLEEIKNRKNLFKVKDLADVEVGITTGANDFFTVSKSVIDEYNLSKYSHPLIGRSVLVSGITFDTKKAKQNIDNNAKANILIFPKLQELKKNESVQKYIEYGIQEGFADGYKCRIREEWQIIPSVSLSNAFFSRRNNKYARMILNEANAYTTDTMHRVHIKDGINKKAFVASYYNSLSFCFVELEGRSFGGGALELMPSEVSNIIIPYSETALDLFYEIETVLKNKEDINKLLKYTNKFLLKDNLGFTTQEINLIINIHEKLLNKRLFRKTS